MKRERLTCCTRQCRATRCFQLVRRAFPHPRNRLDPTPDDSRSISACIERKFSYFNRFSFYFLRLPVPATLKWSWPDFLDSKKKTDLIIRRIQINDCYYHFNELWQFKIQPNCQLVRTVVNWSDESIVIAEQIVVEPFGVHISEAERPHLKMLHPNN